MNRLYNRNNRVMGKSFIALGMLIIMMSCGKDIDQFIPRTSQASTGDVSRLVSRLRADLAGEITTTVSCPCAGDKAFQIDEDVVLVVPPDFVDLNAYPCTTGHFDITVTTCDTKGEILISGLPTISENKLLESRIELNLSIHDGDQSVRLAHGKQIRILVNDPDPRERMELFYGGDDQWIQADSNPNTWDNVSNSEWWIQQDAEIITGFGYECFSDSLDWINVDVFFEVPESQRTPVYVRLPEEFTNRNTQVFMVFDDYKSILTMDSDSASMQFYENHGATPVGFHVTFVAIAEMGEDCYLFDEKSTIITPGHIEELDPRKTPYEEIKKYLNNL